MSEVASVQFYSIDGLPSIISSKSLITSNEILDISNYSNPMISTPVLSNASMSNENFENQSILSNTIHLSTRCLQQSNEHQTNFKLDLYKNGTEEKRDNTCSTTPSEREAKDELMDIFISWGLQNLYERFKYLEMTVETLKYVKYRHIDNFFAPAEIALKIKFEHFLLAWQSKNNIQNEFSSAICSNCGISKGDPGLGQVVSQTQQSDKSSHVSIRDILNKNVCGDCIKTYYAEKDRLEPRHRNNLCVLIVEFYLLQLNYKHSAREIKNLANEIVECFPKANVKTYFVHRGHQAPIGELYNKFNYLSRKFNCQEKSRRPLKSATTKSISLTSIGMLPDEEYDSIKTLLKHLRSPREAVLDKWRITSTNRIKELLDSTESSLEFIFETWPIYKNPLMLELIDIDFNNMYPERCLYTAWCDFENKIICILRTRISQPKLKQQLETLLSKKSNINLESFNTELLLLLCSILPNALKHCKNTAYSRCTIKDSQDWFIIRATNVFQMELKINERNKKSRAEKNKIQPYLFAIGQDYDINQFVIIMDSIKYICGSLLEAIDKMFKSFQIFNLHYPTASYNIWLFVQKYLYKIDTPYDSEVPAVVTLITDLNNRGC